MKLRFQKDAIVNGINIVMKAVPSKTTMSILECILIDALRVIDDEEINIYMMNPKSPCFIKDDEENYIYLILPVNFNAATV